MSPLHLTVLLVIAQPTQQSTQDTQEKRVVLSESIRPGSSVEVASSVNLRTKPKTPTQKATPAAIVASGGSRYRERIIALDDDSQVLTTARKYIAASLDRTRGDEQQKITIRPTVTRIIVRRSLPHATVFSPDGPMMAPEVDLVEADAFTPAFAGLLPRDPIQPGDHWQAEPAAISELTGVHPIEAGAVRCTLREIKSTPDGTVARVALAGSIRGATDQGPTRMTVDGHVEFDLDSQLISRVVFRGRSEILDAAGQPASELEGRYELTRRPTIDDPSLSDDALAGVSFEATRDSTVLLFEHAGLGVRLFYPRNWEIAALHQNTVQLEEPTGGTLRVAIDPAATATAQKLRGELLDWLEAQRALVQQAGPIEPADLAETRKADLFRVTATHAGQLKEWTYFVIRDAERRATLSANLVAGRNEALRDDVLLVARRLEFTPKIR